MLSITEIKDKILQRYISEKRILHSIGVADTAVSLAIHHKLDHEKAYCAGLLHDIAREFDIKDLIKISRLHKLSKNSYDYMIPVVLHANVGSWLVKKDLGIYDDVIVEAIASHTLADTNMNDIAKIIYIADIIEPGRKIKQKDEIKKLALRDLDKAMLFCLDLSIEYLIANKSILHPQSIEARNYYLLSLGLQNI